MSSRPGFEIRPSGGYSLMERANFIGAWHHAPSENTPDGGHLHLAFLTDGSWKPVGVCLMQRADGQVRGEVYGDGDVAGVRDKAARILSLDVDGAGWPEVARRDAVVDRLQRLFPGFRPVNWSDAYEAAAWCLISTRIGMRQAQGVKDRLCRQLGHEVDIHGHRMWTFPEPAQLADMRSFPGLFGRKVEYLNRLGDAALAGQLDTEALRAMAADDAIAALRRLKGIGEWGAQLIRLRSLSAVDELPTTEPRLLAAVQAAYGLKKEPDLIMLGELAEAWRPYRMWVCVCLRRLGGGEAGMTHSRAAG